MTEEKKWAVGDRVMIARPKHAMWEGLEATVATLPNADGHMDVRLVGDRRDHVLVMVTPETLDAAPERCPPDPTHAVVDATPVLRELIAEIRAHFNDSEPSSDCLVELRDAADHAEGWLKDLEEEREQRTNSEQTEEETIFCCGTFWRRSTVCTVCGSPMSDDVAGPAPVDPWKRIDEIARDVIKFHDAVEGSEERTTSATVECTCTVLTFRDDARSVSDATIDGEPGCPVHGRRASDASPPKCVRCGHEGKLALCGGCHRELTEDVRMCVGCGGEHEVQGTDYDQLTRDHAELKDVVTKLWNSAFCSSDGALWDRLEVLTEQKRSDDGT